MIVVFYNNFCNKRNVVYYSYNRILTDNVEKYNYKLSGGVKSGPYDVFMSKRFTNV